ncbi:MAG TPA: cystathionine beta-lyase [Planctomycetaceae bacterium]|nr:cystathionine beta-lyase [Planctomycetaceae bacterium]
MKHHQRSQETLSVHAGKDDRSIGVVNAIEPSSAFHYFDEQTQLYPRYFNTPNQRIVAEQLAQLEGAEASLVFASGMAAISTTLLSLLAPGDHIVLQEALYGGTDALVRREFDALGIEYTFTDCNERELLAATKPNTKVIYAETPANPLLEIVDLQALAEGARRKQIITVVDNTFATPICQTPIRSGIDIVLHSGTKYLSGHSDLSFGAACTSELLYKRILDKAVLHGGNVNALTCYLIERSIKTLAVRVQRQCENATQIAHALSEMDSVEKVYYPGLKRHPGYEIAASQMSQFGGMLSFTLAEGLSSQDFLQALELITPAMSLGGVESTVTVPALTSHKAMPDEQRRELGIHEGLVRLSVGIENVSELLADITQAIDRTRSGSVPKRRVQVFDAL